MEVGRKLYYDNTTGIIVLSTGERKGSVLETTIQEDFNLYPSLKNRTLKNTRVLQLQYGERVDEFEDLGSYHVSLETQELIIYPRVKIAADKKVATIGEVIRITASIDSKDMVEMKFKIDEDAYPMACNNGIAGLEFVSEIPGVYEVEVDAYKYGKNFLVLEVVDDDKRV